MGLWYAAREMTKLADASALVLLVPFAILLAGCAASPAPGPETPAAVAAEAEGEADTTAAAQLRRGLRAAVGDRSGWESLHLVVGCLGDAGMRSMEVYGSGIGIWGFDRQFELSPEEVSALLRTLDQADFAGFADVYGGRKGPDPRLPDKKEASEGSALRVICRVVVSLGGQTRQSVQLAKGEQSAELKGLAGDLLAIGEGPAREGIAAADLTDGLEKVARGELAPQAFRLLLNRKPDKASAEEAGDGFLLRLAGSRVISRGYDPAAGQMAARSLTLTPAEVADLARDFVRRQVAQLPANLFAVDYRDLTIEVLNHKKNIQARQFAGMTPTTHADSQVQSEQVFDALHRLHRRVMSEGEPAGELGGAS